MSAKQPPNGDDKPQSWVVAHCANIRFLGVQMGEAIRKFEASWLDAQNRAAAKREHP